MVRLWLRLMEMGASPTASFSLLQRAVDIGPGLVATLVIIDGEGCKLVAKYTSLLQLAKARLEAVISPIKENIHPGACNGEEETHPAHLGEEVKKENNCVASGAEQNAIMDKGDPPESQPHNDDECFAHKRA